MSHEDWVVKNNQHLIKIDNNIIHHAFYMCGLVNKERGHYSVPATMDNAVYSLFHSPRITVWSIEWMKRSLRRQS